jgi:dihydrodipicolinate synthase/N-acetylneuraminate lyase
VNKLADMPNTVGIKLSIHDIARFQCGLQLFGQRISVLCGEEAMFVPGMFLGAMGGVIMTSNFAPEYWVKIYHMSTEGRLSQKYTHFHSIQIRLPSSVLSKAVEDRLKRNA